MKKSPKSLKMQWKYFEPRFTKTIYAAYFKQGKWRIYEGSGYIVRSKKSAQALIQEVCEEMRVKPNKVKLATAQSVIFKPFNTKTLKR